MAIPSTRHECAIVCCPASGDPGKRHYLDHLIAFPTGPFVWKWAVQLPDINMIGLEQAQTVFGIFRQLLPRPNVFLVRDSFAGGIDVAA